MKRLLPILAAAFLLPPSRPAAADERRSNLSLAVEGGLAYPSGKFAQAHDGGGQYGGRILYRARDRWTVGALFTSRTFRQKNNRTQTVLLQPFTAAVFYRLTETGFLAPYAFLDLGFSHNRRALYGADKSGTEPVWGLGAGVDLDLLDLNSLSLEAAYRRFSGASVGGHDVASYSLSAVLRFHLPDGWVPQKPDKPLNLSDADIALPPPPTEDVEKAQAQQELDQIQRDIRDKKIPPIHFETGQAVLLPASYETLDIVGTILRRYPHFKIRVAGHTDDVGSAEDNQILAQARAEVVRAYLVQNFALPAEKLTSASFGEEQPIADNTSEEGRALNRRVEFTITP